MLRLDFFWVLSLSHVIVLLKILCNFVCHLFIEAWLIYMKKYRRNGLTYTSRRLLIAILRAVMCCWRAIWRLALPILVWRSSLDRPDRAEILTDRWGKREWIPTNYYWIFTHYPILFLYTFCCRRLERGGIWLPKYWKAPLISHEMRSYALICTLVA